MAVPLLYNYIGARPACHDSLARAPCTESSSALLKVPLKQALVPQPAVLDDRVHVQEQPGVSRGKVGEEACG